MQVKATFAQLHLSYVEYSSHTEHASSLLAENLAIYRNDFILDCQLFIFTNIKL